MGKNVGKVCIKASLPLLEAMLELLRAEATKLRAKSMSELTTQRAGFLFVCLFKVSFADPKF